jgi:hypothetical protein
VLAMLAIGALALPKHATVLQKQDTASTGR